MEGPAPVVRRSTRTRRGGAQGVDQTADQAALNSDNKAGSFTPPPAVTRTYARRRHQLQDRRDDTTSVGSSRRDRTAKGGTTSASVLAAYDPTVPLSPGFKRARSAHARSSSSAGHSPPKRRRKGIRDQRTKDNQAPTIVESPSTTPALSQDIWLPTFKKLRVIHEDAMEGGCIVMLNGGDDSTLPKRVQQLVDMVNEELGWNSQSSAEVKEEKTFIFVTKTKQAIGCLMVERVEKAYRVVGEKGSECSTQPEPAVMGISRVWVHREHRRKGVASQLLDTARAHFVYGYTVPKAQCAFTQPTRDGHSLASQYLADPHFLVYK